MFDLTGRVALVTGAGRNIGAGIARALASRGAAVAVNDIEADRAERVVRELSGGEDRSVAVPFDVTDEGAVRSGVASAVEALGPIDILVNNAGIPASMTTRRFDEMDPSEWRPYVDLNLYGALHCTRAVLPDMADRGHGRIVQISSTAGRTGVAFGVSIYGASKSAIEGFVRHLSQEVAGDGVTVNSVALGIMATADEGLTAALARTVPVGRAGTPEDVGGAVVYLASDEAAWLTGQTIHLNGGAATV